MNLKMLAGETGMLPAREASAEHETVLQGLRDRAFMMSERYAAQQLRAPTEGARAEIVTFHDAFQRQLRALGVPMFAHCFVRDSHAQDEAYATGHSKAQAGESPHNFGCAVDIVHSRKAWSLTKREWSVIGHIGKDVAARNQMKIDWGGDWKFWDPAHWEIRGWRRLVGLTS
ncbi:M15 family metallopeptidase [Mesorhizobium sp. M0410]|uniref:M15 family metallopeptidase n=1 Tax=Mesorhizobium sp. M0410 TaxID=2956943 RepID=UPI0033374BBE